MKFKKVMRGDILFILLIVTFLSIFIYRIYYRKEINNNPITTVAYANEIFSARRSNMNIVLKYCFDNVEYEALKAVKENPKEYLYKYYKIKISNINPDKYLIDLNKEVADSSEIKNSCIWKKRNLETK